MKHRNHRKVKTILLNDQEGDENYFPMKIVNEIALEIFWLKLNCTQSC